MEKNKVLQIRLTEREKQEIDREAYSEGKTVTEYLLEAHQLRMREKGKCPCCGQVIKK